MRTDDDDDIFVNENILGDDVIEFQIFSCQGLLHTWFVVEYKHSDKLAWNILLNIPGKCCRTLSLMEHSEFSWRFDVDNWTLLETKREGKVFQYNNI